MLDHARAVHEVELIVGERQPVGRVRAHERPRVARPLGEVDAGDVQIRLERAQADLPAADIEHPCTGRQAR